MIPVFVLTLFELFAFFTPSTFDTVLELLSPLPDPCHVYAGQSGMFTSILVLVCICQLLFHPHLYINAIVNVLLTVGSIICLGIDIAARYMFTKIITNKILRHSYCAVKVFEDVQNDDMFVVYISDQDTAVELTHDEDSTDEDIFIADLILRAIQIKDAIDEILRTNDISLEHDDTGTAPVADISGMTQYIQDLAQPAPVVQASLHAPTDDAAVGTSLSDTDNENIVLEGQTQPALSLPAPVIQAPFFALTVDADGNSSITGLPQSYAISSSGSTNSSCVSSPPYPIVWPEEANELEMFWNSRHSLFPSWDDKLCADWANEVARELHHRRHMRNLQFNPITSDQRKWTMNVLIHAYEDSERYAQDHIDMATDFSDMGQYYMLMMQHTRAYPIDASDFQDDF